MISHYNDWVLDKDANLMLIGEGGELLFNNCCSNLIGEGGELLFNNDYNNLIGLEGELLFNNFIYTKNGALPQRFLSSLSYSNYTPDELGNAQAELEELAGQKAQANQRYQDWDRLYQQCVAGKNRSRLYSCQKNQGYKRKRLEEKRSAAKTAYVHIKTLYNNQKSLIKDIKKDLATQRKIAREQERLRQETIRTLREKGLAEEAIKGQKQIQAGRQQQFGIRAGEARQKAMFGKIGMGLLVLGALGIGYMTLTGKSNKTTTKFLQ